jgi:hypothetical protein
MTQSGHFVPPDIKCELIGSSNSFIGMVLPSVQTAKDGQARDRAIMVARHLAARGICDELVLAAMGTVPRETFVAEALVDFAYEDSALPIEGGQTLSQLDVAERRGRQLPQAAESYQ